MKTFLSIFVIILCFPVMIKAQSNVEAPMGLAFGSDMASVKSVMNNKGTFDSENIQSYGKSLLYSGVSVGVKNATLASFKFTDNKLFEVSLVFEPSRETEIEDMYDSICDIINAKYGRGESFRNFKYPYDDTDDDFLIALKGGYATIKTYWMKFDDEDSITVGIEKYGSLCVILKYQNGKLIDQAQNKQKELNTSEF